MFSCFRLAAGGVAQSSLFSRKTNILEGARYAATDSHPPVSHSPSSIPIPHTLAPAPATLPTGGGPACTTTGQAGGGRAGAGLSVLSLRTNVNARVAYLILSSCFVAPAPSVVFVSSVAALSQFAVPASRVRCRPVSDHPTCETQEQ